MVVSTAFGASVARAETHLHPRFLRGLIDLPALFDDSDAVPVVALPGIASDAAAIELYAVPYTGVGAPAHEAGPNGLVTVERAAGRRAALYFDERRGADGDWYLLGRQSGGRITGYAWHRAGPDDEATAYADLLMDAEAYMRNGWDGRLYATPADPTPLRVIPPSGGGAIRVADAWMDPRDPTDSWLLIVVYVEESVCGDEWPVVVASGWVRAYREDAEPAAWFHAGGC